MTPVDVIGLRSPQGFLPSPRFLALWRGAAGRKPLSPMSPFADRAGLPTPLFLAAMNDAFAVAPSVQQPVVSKAGTATDDFLALAGRVGL